MPSLPSLRTTERRINAARHALFPYQLATYEWLATRYRRRLSDPVFIGVTGSCGKTTTKDLIAAVLSASGPGRRSPGTKNCALDVARTILAVRRSDRYCVQEIGASGPGSLDRSIALLRPDVAVVTAVGSDHLKSFRTPEAVALEKGKLVAALPPTGVAVLNADDAHVLGMRARCAGRVLTFGRDAAADVRATEVAASWPERLSFTVVHDGEAVPVRTRLVGAHWVSAVLAALATGVALGVPLADAAAAVAGVEPWKGRMSPERADGVDFISDDWKSPHWSLPAALDFMRSARAARKIIVFGTVSDYGGSVSRTYTDLARAALDVADQVIFTGRQAERCARAKKHPRGEALTIAESVEDASRILGDMLRPGDLVLVKGSNRADHLERLILARRNAIACWRAMCGRKKFCSECRLAGLALARELDA